MHELSIAQALIDKVNRVAETEGATRVMRIAITVGALSGVDPEALEFAFPIAAEGSAAAHASLDITRLPARVLCSECGRETCPECNNRDFFNVSLFNGATEVLSFSDLDAQTTGSVTVELNAVPLPAAAWLFSSALLGLGWA